MIIPNGHIRVITATGGGFINGKPMKATTAEGEPIEANIRRTSRSTYDSGQQAWVTKEGYSILVPFGMAKPGDTIAVFDHAGQRLGNYQIRDAQDLTSVAATEITI